MDGSFVSATTLACLSVPQPCSIYHVKPFACTPYESFRGNSALAAMRLGHLCMVLLGLPAVIIIVYIMTMVETGRGMVRR